MGEIINGQTWERTRDFLVGSGGIGYKFYRRRVYGFLFFFLTEDRTYILKNVEPATRASCGVVGFPSV